MPPFATSQMSMRSAQATQCRSQQACTSSSGSRPALFHSFSSSRHTLLRNFPQHSHHPHRVSRLRTIRCVQILDIPSNSPNPNASPEPAITPELLPQPIIAQESTPTIPLPPAPPTPAPQIPPIITSIVSWYDKCLQDRPVLTKSCTALAGFIIGDMIAQAIEGHTFDTLNIWRCLRLGSYGFFIDGPVQHYWYGFLDRTFWPEDPTSNKAVITKTAVDQIIWSSWMTCVFFTWLKLLEGRPDAVIPTIMAKVVPTMAANYLFWPMVHLYNFKYIPTEYRVLYNQVMCIIWITFLSFLTHHGFHLPGLSF